MDRGGHGGKERDVWVTTSKIVSAETTQRKASLAWLQSKLSWGLWKHHTKQIQFCMVVNDFGIKYSGKENAQHLKQILEQHYEVTTD